MHWNNKVVWSEGMFLQQQHFQQHDRYLEQLVEARTGPLSGHFWGFVGLSVDPAALGLGKVQLTSGHGILPDGTPFEFPGHDDPPEPLDVAPDTRDELIVLALPLRRPGTYEVAVDEDADDGGALARFFAGEAEVGDANTSSDGSVPMRIGRLRLRLLRQSEVTGAYCTLGVVKVTERHADNQLILDRSYIPPVLHAACDTTLIGYAREIHGLIHQRGDALASRLGQPGRGGVAEIADFLFLQTLNRYELLFQHLTRHPLLHPERLYSTCLLLAGDLATFSHTSRRPPVLPEYAHDALSTCFPPLIAEIRMSLSMVLEQSAIPIDLQDRKYGVRVAVIPDLELLKEANFVLAVNAQLPGDTLRLRFPTHVKIGPVERIRDLVNLQLPGIQLRSLPIAPRQIPYHAGFNYFELDREGELWKQLDRSGGLAMHIAGDFPGIELEFWAIRG
jgi:type VI secretion system protein ImpJ